MSKLWRSNPRSANVVSLGDQFTRSVGDVNVWPDVATDLFFGPDETPSSEGAFAVSGQGSALFYSQSLYGPPPGITAREWFRRDDTRPIVLAELTYLDQVGSGSSATPTLRTAYLASSAYYDDENSRIYRDCIKAVPRYSRSLDRQKLRGKFTVQMGTMDLHNDDGFFDYLLTLACDGSEVRFYVGDESWARSQFIYVFSAFPTKVTAPARNLLQVSLKDGSALLNRTVGGSQTVGGTEENANEIRPYNFGYVRNVECKLVSFAEMRYAHSQTGVGSGQAVYAVRDRGVPVGFEDDHDGTIRLHAPAAGTITADVLTLSGLSTYSTDYPLPDTPSSWSTRISDAFYTIVVNYALNGPLATRYAGAAPSFEFHGLNDYHVGVSLPDAANTQDVLEQLCDTGNCFWAIRRDGYFYFGRIRPDAVEFLVSGVAPALQVPIAATITTDDVKSRDESGQAGMKVDHLEPTYYAVQGYANANQLQQTDFADSVSVSTRALYSRKGYYNSSYVGEDGSSATAYLGSNPNYRLFQGGAPQLYHRTMTVLNDVKTLISPYSDRDAGGYELASWQSIRRAQFLPWVEYVDFDVDLSFYTLELGDAVKLDLDRWNLSGVFAEVVSIDISLTDGTISLGLVRRNPAISTY